MHFLTRLESVIQDRKNNPMQGSYTCGLFEGGVREIAQKVGEEAVEVVIQAVDGDLNGLKHETADLLYHLLVLLLERGLSLNDIVDVLEERHNRE